MRKLVSLMHVSLDGFCAGPNGEMNWIGLGDAIFADVHGMIATVGAAVYGRTTYGMMRGYWPTVATRPDSSARELRHAQWVEAAPKHTFSRTLESSDWNNVHLHKDARAVLDLKQWRAWAFPLIVVALGLVCGLPAGPIMSLPARVLQPGTRAIGMGVFYTVYYAAMMLGPVIGGNAAKWTGSAGAAFDVGAIALLACPLLLLGFNQIVAPRHRAT